MVFFQIIPYIWNNDSNIEVGLASAASVKGSVLSSYRRTAKVQETRVLQSPKRTKREQYKRTVTSEQYKRTATTEHLKVSIATRTSEQLQANSYKRTAANVMSYYE